MKTQLLMGLAISTGNILGPLALFGGIGWWLSERSGSNSYVIIGIFIAFVLSNILILTTTTKMMKLVNKSKQSDGSHESNWSHAIRNWGKLYSCQP